jgi:hypothetical protein
VASEYDVGVPMAGHHLIGGRVLYSPLLSVLWSLPHPFGQAGVVVCSTGHDVASGTICGWQACASNNQGHPSVFKRHKYTAT